MKSLEDLRNEEINHFKEYTHDALIEISKNWKNQNWYFKFNEFFSPSYRSQDRELARKVLSERGINYQDNINSNNKSSNYKSNFNKIVNFTKKVFFELFSLIANPYDYKTRSL